MSEWQVIDIADLQSTMSGDAAEYKEFLNVPALSCGLYHLAAGSKDMQTPHDEDEAYYVIRGKAKMKLGDEDREIGPGMVLYVGATSAHSFFEIEEDMDLLVFFANSERVVEG